MSRNLTFFILGLISAVVAYIFYPSLLGGLELIATERLPRNFIRMVQNSNLLAFAGFISLFGLTFFLLYMIFPVFYVWYHISSAKNIIAKLPLYSDIAKRTDKKTFLSRLKGLGYIEKLATAYGPYLIQLPEEEVNPDALKNSRLLQKAIGSKKNTKLIISPVKASAPAGTIFNVDSLVSDHMLLGCFTIFSRMMVAAGVVCIGISIISFSLFQENADANLQMALQPGIIAFLYLLTSAIIISGITHLVILMLSQNARLLARMINGLFHQYEWQQDINSIQGRLAEISTAEQFEGKLLNSFEKSMREISKAVKALAVEQEDKLGHILSKTLDKFTENMMTKSTADMENLNKTLQGAAQAADQMKKQFENANSHFTSQMNKQSTAISKHLTDMQKVLSNSQKTTLKSSEKIVSSLAAEVETTYDRLGKFMESSLKTLEERHVALEKAVTDKNSILKDLHDSAKDMGMISNASGNLLDRFISLSTELDGVLKNIQENGMDLNSGNAEKREKLKLAMIKLKKANNDRIDKLPDM